MPRGWSADRAARTVPLRLFGDDASVCITINCNIVLLCSSSAVRLPALLSRVPICVTQMQFTDSAAFRMVYKVLVWSFRVLAGGVWPRCDPWGKEWPLGSSRRTQAKSRQRLAGPWTGMLYEAEGAGNGRGRLLTCFGIISRRRSATSVELQRADLAPS